MDDNILKSTETTFEVEFDSNHDAEIVYNSLKPEITYSHNDRSTSEITLKENSIIITIHSQDVVALRASINSYVRWIKLSTEILKL